MGMNAITDPRSQALSITARAAGRISKLVAEDGNDKLMFRIAVSGGGCSGFQYGFSLDDTRLDEDVLFERDGVTVVVDTTSLELIRGGEVDFVEEMVGSYFQVRNPNATSTCGCGTSFSVG
jgi:iron-sulfur cluster insertion protein